MAVMDFKTVYLIERLVRDDYEKPPTFYVPFGYAYSKAKADEIVARGGWNLEDNRPNYRAFSLSHVKPDDIEPGPPKPEPNEFEKRMAAAVADMEKRKEWFHE